MQFEKKKKSISESDVVVIGGGTAGVFAAISAAKNGVKTILVEKNSTLGGTVTTGGVNFPGLFFMRKTYEKEKTEKMDQNPPSGDPKSGLRYHWYLFQFEIRHHRGKVQRTGGPSLPDPV